MPNIFHFKSSLTLRQLEKPTSPHYSVLIV